MPTAVRFENFGGVEVLQLVEVPTPAPRPDQVVVRVVTAGINPGEASIREGLLEARFPTTFPCGEGADLAGVVTQLGSAVTDFAVGDEVVGWTDERASHAEFVAVPAATLVAKPAKLDWRTAGGLFVAGTTAYAAVRAVAPKAGETVVISGAAGGVGSLAAQLALRTGARVIGVAGADNQDWLRSLQVTPVPYGDGLAERIGAAAPAGVDGFIDTFGSGYVELALELGVPTDRIDTIIDFEAAREHGVKAAGSAEAANRDVVAELAELLATGELMMPIAATYPLAQIREAYTELSKRHTRGKIVLTVSDPA